MSILNYDEIDLKPGGYERIAEAARRLPKVPTVLVAHSGAGALVPAIAAAWREATAAIFVDALLPHGGKSWLQTLPAKIADQLRRGACHGRAPPWPRWFPPAVMEKLIPDATQRDDLVRTAPRVPMVYLEEIAPSPAWLPPSRCAYLRLSEAYADEMVAAARLGWRTASIDADHLAIMTRPELVAAAILALAGGWATLAAAGDDPF